MDSRRTPIVAREGIPFLIIAAAVVFLALRYLDVIFVTSSVSVLFVFYLVFRDPRRIVPAEPLGVVSPVDGRVVSVELADKGLLQGEGHIIRIRIDAFGTYTARAPVEGKIMNLRSAGDPRVSDYRTNAMWIQTDEGDDVVLQFSGYRLGFAPRAFIGFGERVGQGQRCAYLRLTRFAEIHLPIAGKVQVEPGQSVLAGISLLGSVPHH